MEMRYLQKSKQKCGREIVKGSLVERKKITNEIEKFRKRKAGESGGGLEENDEIVVEITKLQGLGERKVEGNTFFFFFFF